MDSKQFNIGRLVADPAASFRAEGSGIAATDPTLDSVVLVADTKLCSGRRAAANPGP